MDKEELYDKCIVIVGPIGSGKSITSREIARKLNIPYITSDFYRHLPHLDQLQDALSREVDLGKRKKLVFDIKKREKMPNLPNYEDMGFNGDVSNYCRDHFGLVAWHFYQKQFEIKLLKAITEQIKEPCVIDLGGGMPICLDDQYKTLSVMFMMKNKELFKKYFDMKNVSFKTIKKTLAPFKNVVELQLPANYKAIMEKAGRDGLNDVFIESGQYHKVAKRSISTASLIQGKTDISLTTLDEITNEIITKCTTPSAKRKR